ncbi:MAG: EAL domain-containing protein [Amphritea sp.]|nr:EAL domain-containing protein [Amphritea sp.]
MTIESKWARWLVLIAAFTFSVTGSAAVSFEDAFERHSAVMLLIDPSSGKIIEANTAASEFYGYPISTLQGMAIQQINTLTPEQVAEERIRAQKEGRNYFIFRHRSADNQERTVEVHSIPIEQNNRKLLFSIISDISDIRDRNQDLWHYQEQLEEMVAIQTEELRSKTQLIIYTMGISIVVLIALLIMLMIANSRSRDSRKRAEEQEATLDTIFNNITDAIIYTDRNRNIVTANRSAKAIFGYSDEEFNGASAAILYASTDDYIQQGVLRFSPEAEPHTDLYEITYQRRTGETFLGETMGSVIKNPAGEALGFIGVIRDITERKDIEEDLRRAASVFGNASEGIIITSADGTILDVNDAYTTITGYSRDEAVGHDSTILKSGFHDESFYQAMWERLQQNGHWEGEILNRHKNGHTYIEQLSINAVVNEKGETQSYIGLFYDITPQKEHEKQLQHIAHYDALTELPNRLLFSDRLQQGMLHADRQGDHLAVVYIDLDGFKEINDHYGHDIGDKLLIEMARRMRRELREGDTIARLGGDEFVAVFSDLGTPDSCKPLLDRILQSISDGVKINGKLLNVTASLGVTFYPGNESEPDQLLRQADQAMYQAKLQNKNGYHIFDPVQDLYLKGRHERIERLQQALHNNEFVLYYQPKVNMRTDEIIGAEALIRWQHPEKGMLPPAVFLPDIEDHALDIELGNWVINNALQQLSIWQAQGLDIQVSVNVSAQQLQTEDFPQQLRILLNHHPAVDPHSLELEILESSALQDLQHVSELMSACSELGVRFALDDFGTGYSSLTYLRTLPVSVLKIDRTFVNDMLNHAEDMTIIKGVMGLAQAFQRELVAEGVETPAQGQALLQLGCEIAQGYGIAHPMPAADIAEWSQRWQPPATWKSTVTDRELIDLAAED